MDGQRKPYGSWLGRLARGRRLDRNPLRRGSDRAETVILALLAAGFVAAAPSAAVASGAWEHSAAHREQLAQEASRHAVPAVVLTVSDTYPAAGTVVGTDAKARWTAPDGARITSQIPVPSDTPAGTTVRIWVARDGTLTGPPLTDSQVSTRAVLAEIGAVTGLAVTIAVAGAAARKSLDRHRMAAWEADWRAAGPRWTTRA